MAKRAAFVFLLGFLMLLAVGSVAAQAAASPAHATTTQQRPTLSPPAAALEPAATFDVEKATDAYLAKVPPDKKARSDAYFEGGYWLILWDFLISAVVFLLMLRTRLSARMRDLAERITRCKPLQTVIYILQFVLVYWVVTLPMTIYESYFRERQYGLLNQTFGPWFGEALTLLGVNLILAAVIIAALFGIVRKLAKTWWVWGSVASVLLILFVQLLAPVYVFPLFNKFTKLEDPSVKEPILAMARANGIPVTEVYTSDASRQSNRVSANVSGFLGTQRITLNDNMLRRCSLPEIEMVMGHEMGHYVLNHSHKFAIFLVLCALVTFSLMNWGINAAVARWGQAWDVRGITDIAVLPLAALILFTLGFLSTPIFNTAIRMQEAEADIFGLNASQQPDGQAEQVLKLGEFRKLSPGPWEEIVFFDHPSGRSRIHTAMRWKKEHLPGSPLVSAPQQ